ncbi:MAG: cupin domain-containing protein, partial [Actinomycetota bacterium]
YGEFLQAGQAKSRIIANEETTCGAFTMTEGTFPAGMAGPPPHFHHKTYDTFYVLEGMLHLRVGDHEIDAEPGSYVIVPPGVVHTFANTSDAPVRFLNINTPAGWENYLRDLSKAIASGVMPGGDEFRKLTEPYDFEVPG